jgi:hypothetical protein
VGTCSFCERDEIAGGYLQPPLCAKHHALAVVASMLRSRGQPVTAETIKQCVALYPKAGIRPDEVEALYAANPHTLHPNRVTP